MKKIFLIIALLSGTTAVGIASHAASNLPAASSLSAIPSAPTHRAVCLTNPDNPRNGEQDIFLFAYDDNGVIWVYGTTNETFSAPIRTAPSGRSDFKYKFMRAGVLWSLPA